MRVRAWPARDWRYLGIALKELAQARVRHAVRPTGAIVAQLQRASQEARQPAGVPADPADLVQRSLAIGRAARLVPWRSDCLLQAMAADRWLRRDGLQPDFYLGVKKDETGAFQAHAWLQCAGVPVTGGPSDEFAPLLHPSA